MKKNKLFTLINIGGLSSGIAIALLLFLYIQKELSFDQHFSQKNNIYRLIFNAKPDAIEEKWGGSPNIAGPTFKSEIPEIKEQVRLIRNNFGEDANIRFEDKTFFEKNLYFTDSGFCNVFDVNFIYGNAQKVLSRPNTIVISESTSKKYFGDGNPIGKVLKIDNQINCEVTGVYTDFPANSSIDADLLASISTSQWMVRSQGWSNASFETYLLLHTNSNSTLVEKKMAEIIKNKVPKQETWFSFSLQPFTKVHLESSDINNTYITRVGDKKQVEIISILTVLILLIAGINYMNLSTAQSQTRFKEIGISKTLGASKATLTQRFYFETTLVVLFSLIVGIVLMFLTLPYFNLISDANLQFGELIKIKHFSSVIFATVLIIIFSGSYPAFYLSSFNPKNLFSQNFKSNNFAGKLRQGLMILQFSVSILLIFCTIVLYKQLIFIQEINLGFKPTEVIAVPTNGAENKEQISGLINDLGNLTGVNFVCRSQTFPGRQGSMRNLFKPLAPSQTIELTTCRATQDVLKVLGIKLLAGHAISGDRTEKDTVCEVILNKTAVEFLGYTPEQAIGKKIQCIGSQDEIVGVVEDFCFENIHQPIGAFAFHNAATESRAFTLINFAYGNTSQTLKNIEEVFKKNIPNSAFKTVFLDDHFKSLYKNEKQTSQLSLFFSVLAILLASMGLFGLSAYLIEQRTKEIGVRKTVGAGKFQIIFLVSKQFVLLIIISAFLAIPISWHLMQNWLSGFAYHVQLNWLVCLMSLFIAAITAIISIIHNALKAAKLNPVTSLRKNN
ncbi:MAG: ABC transporter permease [Bacteroidia bacterium]|nr:ABC transporter permease [Bacteroidia bacterium]